MPAGPLVSLDGKVVSGAIFDFAQKMKVLLALSAKTGLNVRDVLEAMSEGAGPKRVDASLKYTLPFLATTGLPLMSLPSSPV